MAGLATPAARASFLTASARRGLSSEVFRWAIVPSIVGWGGFLLFAANGIALQFCLSPASGEFQGLLSAFRAGLTGLDFRTLGFNWALMLVAMMPPLLIPMITYVAAKSFVDRRDLAIGLFVGAYASVWIIATATAVLVLLALQTLLMVAGLSFAGGLVGASLAALWQLSDAKRRALNRRHGFKPLRASGQAANIDVLAFGGLHGCRCVRSCAPTMFLPMLGAHGLTTMVVIFMVLLGERMTPRPRQLGAAVLLVLSGILTVAAPHAAVG